MSRINWVPVVVGIGVFMLSSCASSRGPVVGWRTDGTGRYPDSSPPLQWSPQQNVVWACPMPSWGNATPVVVGDRIFVCSEPTTLICVDSTSGRILWQDTHNMTDLLEPEQAQRVHRQLDQAGELTSRLNDRKEALQRARRQMKGNAPSTELKRQMDHLAAEVTDLEGRLAEIRPYQLPRTHPANGYSTCTPVSDGQRVFAIFGNGVGACYDMNGDRQWIRQIDTPRLDHGQSSSPALVGETLLVQFKNLLALNTQDGSERWRTESNPGFGSPVTTMVGDTAVFVTRFGEVVRAADGKILAKAPGLGFCSPVVDKGVAYFIESDAEAYKLPEQAGEGFELQPLWRAKIKGSRHYASPVVHDGLVYALSRGQHFTILDAGTGRIVFEKKLDLQEAGGPNQAYSSPTLAGEYLFLSSEDGTTTILEPGPQYKEVASNRLDLFRSCPVFVGRRMYVRTSKHLYCIEAPGGTDTAGPSR